MSIFDKLFGNRNRSNCNESALTSETEPFCFRSSHLNIPKDQIRFILFRECDKRGRKLLFDSNSVEKVTLPLGENMCNHKCQQQNEKINNFIETHKTHAYKYKKPSKDVSSLGEMVFGSVAVIYKGGNSYKIHSIPSPKRLMFSTIVNSPSRCPTNTVSELDLSDSAGSSMASLGFILKQQLTVSSDSKLYNREGAPQKYSVTYPWIKQNSSFRNVRRCCEEPCAHQSLTEKSFLNKSNDLKCSENVCLDRTAGDSRGCKPGEAPLMERDSPNLSGNNLCLCLKNSDCEWDSSNNGDSSGITSSSSFMCESENLSSISGSLSSLKRRWMHSYSTSLDSGTYDDTSSSSSKRRTKLGLALILDLSNTLEDKIEKLLFDHTIVIDSAMSKLQACVELAYIRNESFVDLIYEGFLECQQIIHELITGGKLVIPMWCLRSSSFGSESTGLSLHEKNLEADKHLDFVNNLQLKFLVNFYDVLAKFDTKDTNFFISTLLTAVLTHNLSWVTSIAETDLKSPNEKLSVINGSRPYNPIWAQMNDLCGLLGSPLKSAKTVVTGSARTQVAAIIKVLSYFIRCNNITENFFEVDVEDIVGNVDSESNKTESDSFSELEVGGDSTEGAKGAKKECFDARIVYETGHPRAHQREAKEEREKEVFSLKPLDVNKAGSEGGLKRTKSYLSHSKMEDIARPNELYPDIKTMAESENVNVADLDHVENERTILVENFLGSEKFKEKIQKMIRVPSKTVTPPAEKFIRLDGDYDTVDLAKTDNFRENRVQMEMQRSASEERKENIVFLLGENEELVNLHKRIVVNKSSFVDMEKENSSAFPAERNGNLSDLCASVDDQCESEQNGRTFREHCESEKMEESFGAPVRTPCVFHEVKMPRISRPRSSRRLEVSSVLGGVNEHYNSEQVIQGVLEPKSVLERTLQKDLLLCAHNTVLEKNIKEALCILGDMESWEVSVLSSSALGGLGRDKRSGIRVGMSQLVADMLESFQHLHSCSLPPSFCLEHMEKKLREIYLKSKTVGELLSSTELCSIEYLTTKLDIGINDVPLLLSVATTHSPQIAEKYALSFS